MWVTFHICEANAWCIYTCVLIEVIRTVVAPPSSVVTCLCEVLVWGFGVLFLSCACVCRCRGCDSLSVCVCDLLIFLPRPALRSQTTPRTCCGCRARSPRARPLRTPWLRLGRVCWAAPVPASPLNEGNVKKHTHTHTYIYIYTYIRTHIYIYIYIYLYICILQTTFNDPGSYLLSGSGSSVTFKRRKRQETHTHTHTYIYTYIRTHTHTYIYIYMYVSIYIYVSCRQLLMTRGRICWAAPALALP